ncbi:flippase-like domain-containing protein [Candidatus Saccharibacteria bacterium]|nr:flippase-like domain-containing protein [Candidatus Saccharibacteria bacterium]MBH1972922.1 flippase-like domain-containing protein [Candidatus Saccharibacteria bacterium]MBH1991124.1 flippase-like domain-containing protein [Candidatus Saccharibacteria bacterium]
MSFRAWLSVITFLLIAVILYFSRHELVHAWSLLGKVNIWILLLLIPGQIIVYYAGAEMIFSYLRDKGKMREASRAQLTSIALESNFVNHVLPSGGVSGMSYLTWRLGHLGIPAGRATMAQVVKYAMGFVSFTALLLVALFVVTIDGNINRWIILSSALLIVGMTIVISGAIFLFSSQRRTDRFSKWLIKNSSYIVRKVTRGKKHQLVKPAVIDTFFDEMHRDFLELRHDKKLLVKPFLWGLLYTAMDAALFFITFLALGEVVNPAPILIAYGVASMAGFFVLTPGGAGAYEAIMVAFLAVAGLSQGTAIAGIVLTRVILLLGTIIFGYIFYQRTLIRYGKNTDV